MSLSWQPGDNFRIAAVLDGPGAVEHLELLQVTNANAPLYVPPGTNQIPGTVAVLSPMLTVWRKLHLEFDSMDAPPASGPEANFTLGTLVTVIPNSPVGGQSRVKVNHSSGSGPPDVYENGRIEFVGFGAYRVLASETKVIPAQSLFQTALLVDATLGAMPAGTVVMLYDDDDNYLAHSALYSSILGLPSPPLPVTSPDNLRTSEMVEGIKSRFGLAYILPVDGNSLGWNAQRTIPFRRHAEPALSGGLYDAGNQELNLVRPPGVLGA